MLVSWGTAGGDVPGMIVAFSSLQSDGFVEMVAADDRMTAYDGIGALLRSK